MKATEKGCSGNRSKIGKEIYYKGRYYLAFYEDVDNGDKKDERYYAGFNNAIEICKYKKLPVTTTNVNMVYQALYKALKDGKKKHYTTLIDNKFLSVHLIDMIDEIRANERREKEMKKFIQVHSELTIEVYPDLSATETTNVDAHVPDRFAAKPNWVYPVLIEKGLHYYPTEIKNWKAVKTLAKKKLISISEEVDEVPDNEKEKCERLRKQMEKIAGRKLSEKKEEAKPAPAPKAE